MGRVYERAGSRLRRGRDAAARHWAAAARQPWADPAFALLFTVAAVWLVLHGGGEPVPGDTAQAELPGAELPGFEPPPPPPAGVGPDWEQPDQALAVSGTLLVTLPLALRRRLPVAAFAAQFAGVVATGGQNTWITLVALLVGAYSLAAAGRSALVSMAVLVAAGVVTAVSFDEIELPVPGWAAPFVILLPFGLFGLTVRALRARAAASAERTAAVRAGQEAVTRAAVAEERARIARELHDVVSHHVSVMVIQAGAAGKVIDTRPDLARDAITAITESGREAMGELRHALGVLAPAGDGTGEDGAPLRPEPGLDLLDPLVEKVRAAGQPVTVRRGPVTLPRGVDVAAYRVVQEGLTNALRYAPGARTTVVVETGGDALVVEVADEGAAHRPAGAGTGTGLLGLAERLRFHGGTLQAGRRVGGGFRVTAHIPLPGPGPGPGPGSGPATGPGEAPRPAAGEAPGTAAADRVEVA
jgi:signal transduction histidine kinase